ncbi:MAG TPA: hypothetical protein PLG23_05485, partial [Thermoflexales bacterium]|nr:hypothetical protein [Thermoflexales bacterium]HQZ52893.1 hypothetical protein [Thermoflexales bacterium]HRA52911.1 hypothetical protein [Thermoflexales bacterium]
MIKTDPTAEKQQRDGSGRQPEAANEPSRLGDQTTNAACGALRQHVDAGAILARVGPPKNTRRDHTPRA